MDVCDAPCHSHPGGSRDPSLIILHPTVLFHRSLGTARSDFWLLSSNPPIGISCAAPHHHTPSLLHRSRIQLVSASIQLSLEPVFRAGDAMPMEKIGMKVSGVLRISRAGVEKSRTNCIRKKCRKSGEHYWRVAGLFRAERRAWEGWGDRGQ